MAQEVVNALVATLSDDKNSRVAAEQLLENLCCQSGFGICLTQIALSGEVPVHIRQAAGLQLKRHVSKQWNGKAENKPMITDDEKAAIKELLPRGLMEKETTVRTALAMAIASIAHFDWPSKWPELLQSILQCLTPDSNPYLVEGAIFCLEMFARGENLGEEHIPQFVAEAFPHLLAIVGAPVFSPVVKMRASNVVLSCVEWLSFRTEKQTRQFMKEILGPLLGQWFLVFAPQLLCPNSQHYFGFQIAILKIMSVMIRYFSAYIGDYLPQLMTPMWQSFIDLYPVYLQQAVFADVLEENAVLPEGEEPGKAGLTPFLVEVFEVLSSIVYKKKFCNILEPLLEALSFISLSLIQMTEEQVESYASDLNAWVADEKDADLYKSVRVSGGLLLEELVIKFKEPAIQTFVTILAKKLEEGINQNDKNIYWKGREACIYAVGTLAKELLRYPALFSCGSFINQILLKDITSPESHPILRGRALWCAARLADAFQMDDLGPVLNRISEILNSSSEAVGTKIFALRALSKLIVLVKNSSDISNFISGLMEGLISVMDVVKGDTLYVVLKSLHTLIKLSEDVAARSTEPVVNRLLILWAHNYTDSTLVEQLINLFTAYSHYQSCQHPLQSIVAPTLLNIIKKNKSNKTYVNETCLKITKTIVVYSFWPVHTSLINEFFPELLKILLESTSQGTLAKGTDVLRSFVGLMKENLIEWKNENGESGLSVLITIIARLLSDIPDSAASKVGLLIEKVLIIFQFQLESILDQLLTAVLNKLSKTDDLELQSGLLFVIIRLFYVNQNLAIEFLLSKQFGDKTALHTVFSIWTELHESVKGKYRQSFSLIGLINVFLCQNEVLSTIAVKGDIATNTGRSMRSKPALNVYAQEPLKLRIIKLLIREHMVIEEDEKDDYNSDDYSDTDEESSDSADNEAIAAVSQFLADNTKHDPSSPFVEAEKLQYLAQVEGHDTTGYDDEEDDDPDIKNDPIYQVNLKNYITDFFKAFASQDASTMQSIIDSLPNMDKNHLQKIFQ